MSETLRLGIAGLGTVGGGVIKIIQKHSDTLTARTGRKIEVSAVSARDKTKDRGVDLSGYAWEDDARSLATRDDIDVVVEMIGGSEGLAKDLVEAALSNGKHVVTANKALLAHHGFALAKLAESNNVSLNYEAAIAGGIPAVKALREGGAGNQIDAVYGILNGTCNYMMTAMRETGKDFDVILKNAQDLGYAEADPSFDIDGIDAAHKLCLLSSIAFGVQPDFDNLEITGIRSITSTDIKAAGELGYRIKLLGIASRTDSGVMQSMEPCLVPTNSALGGVEDSFNAVYFDGDSIDTVLLTGRGAGEGPTASAVMADIMDIARGISIPTFGVPADKLAAPVWADVNEGISRYYLRMNVSDEAGVMASISSVLAEMKISINDMVQHGSEAGSQTSIVLTTHKVRRADMLKAIENLKALSAVLDEPCIMRIEALD